MYHRFSTAHCTLANQHKKRTGKKQLRIGCAVIKRIKRLLEETSSRESSNDGGYQAMLEPEFYLDHMQQQQETSSVQQWLT